MLCIYHPNATAIKKTPTVTVMSDCLVLSVWYANYAVGRYTDAFNGYKDDDVLKYNEI